METPASHDDMRALSARSPATQVRLEIKSMEIVLTGRHEISDDEMELIEMRYRRALAIASLEELCAQGLLDCI
jgi:hypothetical protein